MRSTEHLVDSVGNWWAGLADGWQNLREKTARALTRFTDHDQDADRAQISWGLLPVDVQETDDSLRVSLEIPGLDKQDIHVEVHEDQLLVRGEKRVERQSRKGRYHIHECAYGSFQRVVPLPASVDESGAHANYERGVLHLQLKKKPARGMRRITIQ